MNSKLQLDTKRIQEIKDRCQKARSGPWISFVEGRDHTSGSSFIQVGDDNNREEDIDFLKLPADDQDFIAHARQDIPDLLDEIDRLKELLKHQ